MPGDVQPVFVHDGDGSFHRRANPDTIVWQRVAAAHWERVLHDLVREHAKVTDSKWSNGLLADWDRALGCFWQVVPKEMLTRLPQPLVEPVLEAAE